MLSPLQPCFICGTPTEIELLDISTFSDELFQLVALERSGWQVEDGACPLCVRRVLLRALMEKGDEALYRRIRTNWPRNMDIGFAALPLPIRLHTDPRFTGKGQTIAFVDSGFFPVADLTRPVNRIRAWANAGQEPVQEIFFGPDERPEWSNWDARIGAQWHGTMTTTVASGNGWLSHGIYSGLASDAQVVLVRARDAAGGITNETITRALKWLLEHRTELQLSVISMSVAGDPVDELYGNPVDTAVAALVDAGVVVVVAAGNDGVRRLIPPATASAAITVGGMDDRNEFQPEDLDLWHSNYGMSDDRSYKPEVVAPSIWVSAPILPGSEVAAEAIELFERRKAGDSSVEDRISELKLVTAYYQSVDGTSFAAPIVASVVAMMREANPTLSPAQIRDLLIDTALFVEDAPRERQGAGVVQPAQAIAAALRAPGGPLADFPTSTKLTTNGIQFVLYDRTAKQVQVAGSWNGWQAAETLEPGPGDGIWVGEIALLPPGEYEYKFILDGERWLDDPTNPLKATDAHGGWNSVLVVG